MKKACVIIPYFGKWPIYFQFYLKSCANNSWLDILFFTDIEEIPAGPPNVKFIKRSLKQIEVKAAELLNLESLKLINTYKLCDLRPLYAKIFEEEIKEYEYWGFGDCDLIYGNLLKFIKTDFQQNIDIISFNEQRNSGSLLLLKNIKKINELYLNFENYAELLKHDLFKGIDEVCHKWDEPDKLKLPKDCLTYWIAHETKNKKITSSYKNRIVEKVINRAFIEYNDREVRSNGEEIAYFHYVYNKDQPIFSFPVWENTPKTFFINEVGFFKNLKTARRKRLIKKYPILLMYYLKKTPSYIYRKLFNE